jgi:hypothetical protein
MSPFHVAFACGRCTWPLHVASASSIEIVRCLETYVYDAVLDEVARSIRTIVRAVRCNGIDGLLEPCVHRADRFCGDTELLRSGVDRTMPRIRFTRISFTSLAAGTF